MSSTIDGPRVGAYGFALTGFEDSVESWLNPAADHWSEVAVAQRIGPASRETVIDDERARIALVGDRSVEIVRSPASVCFVGESRLSSAAMIHPFLAPAASKLAKWNDWITFHAGAFVVNGEAWLVASGRNGGKSTTLAALERKGYPVLADDLVVATRDGQAMCGPRSVDLREKGRFPGAVDIGHVGERRRWRLKLENPVPPESPIAGVIRLEWSDHTRISEVGLDEKAEGMGSMLTRQLSPRNALHVLRLRTIAIGRPPGPIGATVELFERATDV